MKKILFTFCALLISLTVLNAQTLEKGVSGKASCSARKQNMILSEAASPQSTLPHSFDVQNYKLELDIYNCFITPYPKSFTGIETITIKADSTINSVSLDAVNTSLTIDSVSLDALSFTHTNNILNIKLKKTYNTGEIFNVKVYYKHNNVADGAFYVRSGMVFTDCEPEGARKWFPCWDKPSDKATLDLKAKVPANVKLGSNGRLADSVKTGDTLYYNWISKDVIATYLMVMAAKVDYNLDIVYWKKISNPSDSIQMRFYWNTGESSASLNQMKSIIGPMTTYFSTLFGEHPFEKNGFASLNSDFTWGGMENQTLTTICPNCWTESLISHEFSHQWFGDMITCGTWADLWLNEGFATYCESLWLEKAYGYSSYKTDCNNNASGYINSNPGWPIYNPSWAIVTPNTNTLFNTAITYNKGACVLHMLRYVLGDKVFFDALKSYGTDAASFKFKNTVTADFIAKMSQASGQDLSWFFNQWVMLPNHPAYQNGYFITSIGTNLYQVGFIAKQTGANFYKMPIEIKISFATGADTTVRVMNDVNNQLFTFNFSRQPNKVVFDPDNNILLKTATLSVSPVVPVELVTFSAEQKNNNVLLKWKTACETNNKGFEIERSVVDIAKLNSRNWEPIGFVNGKGTTCYTSEYSFKDIVFTSINYVYRLKQLDFDGTFKYSNEVEIGSMVSPERYLLSQNFPNPFNPTTTITYQVPVTGHVSLKVFDPLGKEVATLVEKEVQAGTYQANFDASKLTSGIYFYKLQAGNYSDIKKAILIK